MTDALTHRRRLSGIRRLLSTRSVSTQSELQELLQRDGHRVTQATLSRDLGRLLARRVRLGDGRTVYQLPEETPRQLPAAFEMITSIAAGEAMVVVRTVPGGAQAVGAALDGAAFQNILGTLAGDDTIFIVPHRRTSPNQLQRELTLVWKRGEEAR